jgi:hypothetical protein
MGPVGRTAAVVAGGLVSTALVLPIAGVASPAGAAAACTPVTNIEAIIDDSGSMFSTDSNRLRVQAMDLLINAVDSSTTLGAVEFGTTADVVFPAEAVGPNAAAMKSSLDTLVQADNGGTDYNLAFDTARAADPGATARIFLTDGGHNTGTYNNTHLNPPPQSQTPTYVIGFSAGLSAPADQARLAQIASDTGGKYFPLPDSSALQSVMNQIETELTCQSAPKTFTDNLKPGKSKSHSVTISKRSKSAQLALTWSSPLDKFKIKGLTITQGGHVVASRGVHHLKVKITKGSTFIVVKVTRLVAGKLHFKVKAAEIGSGAPSVLLTTQVSQSKHGH